MNPNERGVNESFKSYKRRRRYESKLDRLYKKGRMFWNSLLMGTYRKDRDGPNPNAD